MLSWSRLCAISSKSRATLLDQKIRLALFAAPGRPNSMGHPDWKRKPELPVRTGAQAMCPSMDEWLEPRVLRKALELPPRRQ